MASTRRSPNYIEGLTAQSTITGLNEYITSTNGVLNTSSSGGGGGNVNLTQVGGSNITLGQALSSASLPVVLPASQITALTPPAAITNYSLETGGNLATLVTNTTGLATSANLTSGTQQTKITDGTNIGNVIAGDTGFNGQATASATRTFSFTTSSSGAQTLLANTNVEGYSWIVIVYSSVGFGLALQAQFSDTSGGTYVNSGNVWQSTANNASATNSLGTNVSTNYQGPVLGNFFQLAISALVSGTFTGKMYLFDKPRQYNGSGVAASQSGTWTVQPGNTPNTVAWLMAGGKTNNNAAPSTTNLGALVGLANASAPSWTEGNEVLLSTDLAGNLRVWNGTNPASTTLNTYSIHLTTNATTTPTAATAYISSITISNEVGGTTSTITIQDKQGTPLKLINGIATTALTTAPTVVNFQTPVKMVSGIDIITAGAVAATVDVWINYYQ